MFLDFIYSNGNDAMSAIISIEALRYGLVLILCGTLILVSILSTDCPVLTEIYSLKLMSTILEIIISNNSNNNNVS